MEQHEYAINGRTPGGWRVVRRPPEGSPFPELVGLVPDPIVAEWIVRLLNNHPPPAPNVAPRRLGAPDAASRAEEPGYRALPVDPSPSPPDCHDPVPEGGFLPGDAS